MKFPSVADVTRVLVSKKRFAFPSDDYDCIDVRLQVTEDGSWAIRTGDSSYDQDHTGFWGASFLSAKVNCRDVAKYLIEEAKEDYACSKP